MKKIAILLLAILIFSCSDDDEKSTEENKGQWAMIFKETVKSDSNPVDRTEKFIFDDERLTYYKTTLFRRRNQQRSKLELL